jgi:hypothetical protein
VTIPNADGFDLHRWFVGQSREPVYRVTWENALSIADDDGNYDNGEQSREFPTIEGALDFGRSLLLADPDDASSAKGRSQK